MIPQNQKIFDQFAASMREEEYTDTDLFDIIAQAVLTQPQLAFAVASHARDISTAEQDMSYTEIIIEIYRRMFFDHDHAHKYGTGFLLDDAQQLEALSNYIQTGLTIDKLGADAANVIPITSRQH